MTPLDSGAWPWVLAGSAMGGMARYWLSGLVARHVGETFPWGTLVVNVSGALCVGLIFGAATAGAAHVPAPLLQLAVVGFLGSYTTVSSFSLQTLQLARNGQWLPAAGNATLSAGLCLGAAWLGFQVMNA
jgi:fluoride exporter